MKGRRSSSRNKKKISASSAVKVETKFKVEMNVRTWVKDSHGLFDYQAGEEHYQVENHVINHDCTIHRDNQCIFISNISAAKTQFTDGDAPEKGKDKEKMSTRNHRGGSSSRGHDNNNNSLKCIAGL
jgi:hypothetical protein